MTSSPEVVPEPLARLFATAYRTLVEGLHERLGQRGWTDVRPAFGFVLLAARGGTTSATELAALMGMTKQAASVLVATMAEAGYVETGEPAADRRQRRVQLTVRGRELLATVEEVYAELEQDWAKVIGERSVERLRTDMARVLRAQHGGVLPAVRPTW